MGQHFEGAGDVERRVGIGQVERAAVADIEPSLPRSFQHSLGQVDAAGTLAELREPLEEKPRPAADLEQIPSGSIATSEIDLEVVDQLVVASGIIGAS